MNPANLPCVAAIRPDVCALANNHVLDFGERGLRETLAALAEAGLAAAEQDSTPPQPRGPPPSGCRTGRILVFCCGTASSASRRSGPQPSPCPG